MWYGIRSVMVIRIFIMKLLIVREIYSGILVVLGMLRNGIGNGNDLFFMLKCRLMKVKDVVKVMLKNNIVLMVDLLSEDMIGVFYQVMWCM